MNSNLKTGILISTLGGIGGLGCMLITSLDAIKEGKGLQSFHTVWLVEENWIQYVVFFISTIIALAVGILLRRIERQRELKEIRELQKKYLSTKSEA